MQYTTYLQLIRANHTTYAVCLVRTRYACGIRHMHARARVHAHTYHANALDACVHDLLYTDSHVHASSTHARTCICTCAQVHSRKNAITYYIPSATARQCMQVAIAYVAFTCARVFTSMNACICVLHNLSVRYDEGPRHGRTCVYTYMHCAYTLMPIASYT